MYNLDTMRIHGELKVRVRAGGLVRGGTSPGSCWSPSLCVAGRESPGELAARLNQLPTHHRRCGARGSAGRQESLGGLGVAGIVVAATARSGEWCTTVDVQARKRRRRRRVRLPTCGDRVGSLASHQKPGLLLVCSYLCFCFCSDRRPDSGPSWGCAHKTRARLACNRSGCVVRCENGRALQQPIRWRRIRWR